MSVEKSIESEIAELIVETLNLEDVKSSHIDFNWNPYRPDNAIDSSRESIESKPRPS